MNNELKQELRALYAGIYTLKWTWCSEDEKQIIRNCIKGNFERLDKLKCSFKIQNEIINRAEKGLGFNY